MIISEIISFLIYLFMYIDMIMFYDQYIFNVDKFILFIS